jgi:hypothetical protein
MTIGPRYAQSRLPLNLRRLTSTVTENESYPIPTPGHFFGRQLRSHRERSRSRHVDAD